MTLVDDDIDRWWWHWWWWLSSLHDRNLPTAIACVRETIVVTVWDKASLISCGKNSTRSNFGLRIFKNKAKACSLSVVPKGL
jgi:hypothetical protein